MDKAAGNQQLQFTAGIWKNDTNPTPSAKKDKFQIMENYGLTFLDMKLSFSSEGDLPFGVFRKRGQKLNYVRKGSNHTPGTLCAIPLEVLNRLAKITSRKPYFNSERVENVYPDHANVLHEAGLSTPIYPPIGEFF